MSLETPPRSLHDGPAAPRRQQFPFRSLSVLDLPAVSALEECIRCGLCLSVCPTYRPTVVEGDSPRGRIALVKAQVEGKADPDQRDIPATYGPVPAMYGLLLGLPDRGKRRRDRGAAESRICTPRARARRCSACSTTWSSRALSRTTAVWSWRPLPLLLYKRSGAAAAGAPERPAARVCRGRCASWSRCCPSGLGRPARARIATVTPPRGERRLRVAFHLCCMNNIMFPDACAASVRVLARNGAEVVTPKNVTCCGAPHETEGEMELGRALARRNIALYEQARRRVRHRRRRGLRRGDEAVWPLAGARRALARARRAVRDQGARHPRVPGRGRA